MIRSLIIEDEPLAAKFLEALLVKTNRVEVVGIARDANWGLTLCSDLSPDAVFLDVHMPGRDGVVLAAELAHLSKPPLVVFTTGNADRACEAFRLHAVDYLVKPLKFSQVVDAVNRLDAMISPSAVDGPLSVAMAVGNEDRLPVKCLEEDLVRLIPKSEILAAICRDRRTWIHTATNEYPTYYVLCDLLTWLGTPPFVRVSRESIVNLQAIEEVVHYGDRLYQVRLRDRQGTCLDASRSGSAHLASLIKPPV